MNVEYTDRICQQIDDEGYCIVPGALSPDQLSSVGGALDRAAANITNPGGDREVGHLHIDQGVLSGWISSQSYGNRCVLYRRFQF
jgi:hypothetical protein